MDKGAPDRLIYEGRFGDAGPEPQISDRILS